MFNLGSLVQARGARRRGPISLVRTFIVLAFAVIQLVLVARILLDLGVIPADWAVSPALLTWSDALVAPVAGLGSGLGGLFRGGGAIPGASRTLGQGIDPVMLAAFAGWTVVEGLVLRVVRGFAAV